MTIAIQLEGGVVLDVGFVEDKYPDEELKILLFDYDITGADDKDIKTFTIDNKSIKIYAVNLCLSDLDTEENLELAELVKQFKDHE